MWKENTVTCEWEFPHVRFMFSHLNYTHSCSSRVDSNFYMWNPHFHMWNIRETHLPLTASHVKFASSSDFYIFTSENKTTPKKKQRRPQKIFTCETCWIHMCNWIQFHIFTHELSENRVNPERLTCVIWKKDITFMWHTWFVVDIMRTRRSEWTSVVFTPTWIQFVH